MSTAAPTVAVHPIPYGDPAEAFAPFADSPHAMLLDGGAPADGPHDPRGRYGYICVEPEAVADPAAPDPFARLAELARGYQKPVHQTPVDQTPAWADLPPFQGGVVALLSYELGRHLERLPAPRAGPALPALVAGLYPVVAAYDHAARKAWVIGSDPVKAAVLARRLADPPASPRRDEGPATTWRAALSRADSEARIRRCIDYIEAGDIFQANITHRFLAERPAGLSAFDIHRRLRARSPAPFGAFVSLGGGRALASASPERFLRVHPDGLVETRPIKGTRPRGATPAEDAANAAALQASEKDRAENLMIVDLLRNDLSRVCAVGSVRVPVLCGLETFARVHHLVSVVEGRLRPGLDAVDLLRAAFPGGSITGAPKIRAMEIIHDLEPMARGPYCGSVAWIGFDGAMDSSIVIRSLVIDGDTVIAQAGGGIVADSDPAAEYDEALVKAGPLMDCLGEPICP